MSETTCSWSGTCITPNIRLRHRKSLKFNGCLRWQRRNDFRQIDKAVHIRIESQQQVSILNCVRATYKILQDRLALYTERIHQMLLDARVSSFAEDVVYRIHANKRGRENIMLKTKDWIVTDTDLQRDPNLILKHAQQRPLIVTAGGRPTAYVLSVEMFDALLERMLELERADLVHHLAKGERQFDSGDFVTLQEAVASAEAAWQLQESSA